MSKTYKGYELIKAIEEHKIEINTKLKINGYNNRIIIYKGGDTIRYADDDTEVESCYFINTEFKSIEDNNIDIEELENDVMRDDWKYYVPLFFNKTNELVRKYNELNREIKELKE